VKWEAIVMFHAAGDDLEPEQLLKKHPLVSATAYRKGDAAIGGERTYSISGFKVDLGAANSRAQLEEGLLKHLEQNSDLYAEVAKAGGQVSVGIGLMVPPKGPRTVTLTPRALGMLAEAGITAHVTGYPWIDDPDDEAAPDTGAKRQG
jgi:hypothetical protein